jgi:phosphoglycerate dehydrogenase-like enzyme
MAANVVVTETLDPKPAVWLAERANLVWCPHTETGKLAAALADAEGLVVRTYTRVDEALLHQAPKLKVVGRAGVGLDNIDLAACRRRGVRVVFTPDANTQAVVEYVFALMLDALRPRFTMTGYTDDAEFHRLRKEEVGIQLSELTLGILGFGRIGKRVGRVAHAIGMKVLANDLLPEADLRAGANYPFECVDHAALYHESDVLTIHVDGRPENRGLIDAAALAQLKPGCLLINAARGMLIDNEAVAAWARQHEADGGRVILDVHDPEPPPRDYPLFGLPNVRLLPHLASRTRPALENMSWVVRDVVAVLEGKEPEFPA